MFHRVLHVPQLQNNLLSVLYLTSKERFHVTIVERTMSFERDGVLLFTATQQKQLAYLDGTTLLPVSALSTTAPSLLPLTHELWHRRLGHRSISEIKQLLNSKVVLGIQITSNSHPDPVCEPCIAGKQHRVVNRIATPLEIVHCDLHGPMPIKSLQGDKYFIVFVDDFTRLWCLYFLKQKSQAAEAFLTFRSEVEKQTGYVVKCLHDDKEGGLSSNDFNAKLRELGITRRFTMRAEPHSNGVAERAIRSIADTATSLLFESHLPSSFWNKAVSTAVYLHNRLPTSANAGKTPYELMYGKKPDVSSVRVFGSLAYVHVKKDKRKGFSPHMEKAIFIGYPPQFKGWEFYNPVTKKYVVSDRADFDERVFPGLATRLPEPPAFPSLPGQQITPSQDLVTDMSDDAGTAPRRLQTHHQVGDQMGDADEPSSSNNSHSSNNEQLLQPTAIAPLAPAPPLPALPQPLAAPPGLPAPQRQPTRQSTRQRVPANVWKSNWYKADYRSDQHRVSRS